MALSNVKKNLKKKAEEARRNSGAVAKLKTAAAQTAKTPKYYSGKNAAGTGAGRKPSASVTTGTRGKIPKNSKPVSNGAVSAVKKRATYQAKKTSYYSGKNASGTGIGMKRTAPVVTGKSGKVKDNQRPLYYRSRDNAQPVRDNPMKRKSDFTNVKNLLQEQRLYRSKDDGTMKKRYGNTPTAYDYSWQTKQQDRKSKSNQRALEQYAQAKSGDMQQAIRDYYEPHNASWRNESWKKLRYDYANKKIYLGDHIMTQEEADRLFPFGSSNPEDRRLLEEAGYQIHSLWPQTIQDASEERHRALSIGEKRDSASDLGKVEDPDLTRILGYQEDWAKAKESGNKEAMANAHKKAEAIRAKYGFSGGDAGDQTIRGDVSMNEYKQLNHEGDAALSMARLKLSRAVTEEEKAKAEQEIQAILSDPEYQADEANRLKLLTSSALKNRIGGTLHMLEGVGWGAENIARGNAMPQWIEMAAEIPDLEAELKTIDEAIATWGYDPMNRDRDEIEKRLKRAKAAEAEIERAKTDKRSDFYVPPDPGKVWSPGTTTPTRWEKMIQEGQNEAQRAMEGWNAAQRFGGELYMNLIQMAPTTLAALIPGVQGTALGTIGQIARGASLASMSLSAGGQRMYELQQRGVPQAEAERGGLAAAGIEYFTEKLPMEYLHSIATGSKRAGIEALKTAGISGAIEGTEEGLSYAGNAAYSYLMGYREDAFSASEMARDMLAGGIMGGFHAGVGVAMNHAINHFIGQGDTQAPKWLLEQADEIDRLLQESEDYKTLAAQGVLSEQEHVDIQDTLRSDLETKLQQIQGVMSQIKNVKSLTPEETEQLRSVLGTDQKSFSQQDMSNLVGLTLSGQMKASRMMENRGETTAERQAREQAEMEARARNLVSLGRTVIDNSTGPVTEAPRTLEEAAEMKTADQVQTDIPPVTYERSRFPMTSVIGSLIDSHRETQARKARDEQVAAERAAAQEMQTQEARTPQAQTQTQQVQAQTPQARSLTNSADMARSSDPVIRTAAMLGVNGGKAIQRAALPVTGNESRLMFSRGFVQVYNQALSGKSNIRRPYFMNETQFNIAVDSATRDRQAGLSREILNSQKAAGFNRNAGLDMSDAYVKGLDRQTVKLMDKVAKDLGVRVQFVEEGSLIVGDSAASVDGGKQTANADISGNVVRIERNNPNPVLALIGHELTHRMQDVSPKAYRAFRDYVMQIPGQAEIVQSTMETYRRRGANINMEGAMDEVAANFAGNLFNSSAELQRFIRENRQNRTLLQRILDVFRDIAAKLTGRERAQADEAVRLLEEALGAASEAVERLGANGNTAQKSGGTRYSTKAEVLALDGVDWMDNYSSIKQQLAKHADEINAMEPVAVIDYNPKSAKKLVSLIMREVTKIGGQRMKRGNVSFEFDETGAKRIDTHAKSGELQAAALVAPYVAKYGKLIAGHKNHENTGMTTLTYAAPVVINGTTVNEGVVIQFKANGSPRAVNIGLQSGGAFKMDIKKAPEGPDSRISRYGQGTALSTTDASNSIRQTGEESKRFSPERDFQATRNVGVEIDADTESASPSRWSLGSWNRSDYMTDRDAAAKTLAKQLKVSQKKAKDFIDAVNSVAKMIADDRAMLDYIASPGRSAFVSNTEYGGSIDFSTICKKRRLFTGTIDAIQRAMPDRVLTADEMLKIRAEMKRRGYEVGCGLCYVEGSRVKIGKYTKEFLDGLKAEGAEYVPTLAEMNTVEGQEEIRLNHPETYEKYVKFMNKLAQRKPKLFQMATEYKREILDAFEGKEETVKEKNKNGGLRLQSFSDFEIIHLIDCMQVIMDMSRVGLAGQAYTKQPEFAWALGETGLKINLSLIAKGVGENGRLIFDDVEGMPIKDAMALRGRYSKNVGTVIVVFNDQQLLAALADDRIDFVLPFHRSQWNKKQYDVLGLPQGTRDYTLQQNEKYILPVRHQNRNGKWVKERPANYMPNEYWNFRKSGKWNAEQYLKMCAENNRRPKFFKLLVNNGNGSYSLQPDGSTDGYWKLLIDFKMYDNEGVGSPQKPVRPEFNMEEAERMLREYTGGHESFPVAQDVVDEFVGGTRFSISAQTDAITMDDVMNLRSIGRKSVNAFTSEEIQKAAPWARKFWQEIGVKSPFFRAWFGDWRSESTDPISLPRIDMAATPSSGNAVNADTERKMSWDTNAARESVLNASRENKDDIQIIASNMDEIVKCAILLDTEVSQPSSKRKMPGTAFMHSFYTVAPLGNRQILVRLFAEEAYSAKQDEVFTRAYSIKHIEKVADLDYGVHPTKGLSSSQSATIKSVADLFALVKQYDPDFKPNPASKIVDADGKPKVVYHQTAHDFWTFDNSNPVAGKTDSETPSGFFFKDNDHDIGIGGARQVAAYLDMKKPLHFRTREAANAWYSKNIDGYKDLQEEMKAAVKPLLAQMDQLERDMFSEETDEEMYEALDQKWNGILADLTKVEDSYRGRLHDMLNRYFLDNDSGYDGIILDYDGHRYVDGKRENVKSYIVFDRTQIKSATHNVGTFDRGNPDTRFSISGTGGFDQAKLMRENQRLRDRVEYWKGQTKRSDRTKADPKEVKKLARKLAGDFSTTMDATEISGQLQAIYDGLGKDWTYDQAYEAAHSLAREMVKQASETDGYLYYEYEPLREHFRKTPLVLSPSDRAGITDYNDWRKAQMGRLRIQHGDQSNIDQVYQELSQLWPEWFDEERDVSSLDQLERIVEVMEGIYNHEETNPFQDDLEAPAGYLAAEIMERFWDMPNVKKTYADRAEARLGREVTRRLDMQEKYQEKLQQVREDRDKKLKQKSEEYLGKKRAASQRQKERERRAQIMRHARELSKKLLKPSDKQHIPQQLREAVAAVLDSVNLSSKNFKDTNRTRAFQELRLAYQDVLQQGESLVIDPDLLDNIMEVEAMRDTPIAEMNLSQLETIWKTIRAVEASITTENKAFGQQRFATIFEAADGLRQAMQSRRDRGDYRGPAGAFDKLLNSGMLTPESYFHRMGETGQDIFRMLRNAQDKHIGIMQEAQDYTEGALFEKLLKEKPSKNPVRKAAQDEKLRKMQRKMEKEIHTFDFDGQKIQLTTAQIMSLYELMKRKQAVDHITVGGIKPEGIEKGIRSKTPSEPYRLTLDQISEIVDSLTEEQMAMADALQTYMGGRLSDLGNEASMAVYGYKKFTEKHYFPIKVDKNQTVTDQTKEAQAATIAGRGFTKSTTPKANNALIVRNIFDVYADHVTDMATYSSWLEAMENLQRIYNFTFRDADNNRTGTTKGYLERAFGRNGLSYWEKLTEDLNNGVHGTNDNPFNSLIGNYKASAIGANIRVFVQQPTAILRALDDINPVDFLAGLGRGTVFTTWKKVKKYAPIAVWKDWGYFDADTGRQMKSILFGDDSALAKVNNTMMAPAGFMDSVGWSHIWNALEAETRRTRKDLKPRTEAFYQAVAARFNAVIDHSQVVDGILQRSQVMRSPDALTKMATSFMAEPTKVYNMFTTAVYDLKHSQDSKARTQAMKVLGRTTFALIASFFANAAAQSLVDALRDDDKDEEYWEKFFQAFYGLEGDEETTGAKIKNGILEGNLGAAFNPATYIPWMKDIVSLAQGFKVSRMDMDSISKFVQEIGSTWEAFHGDGKITLQNALSRLTAEGARLLGIPASNIKRDVLAIYSTVMNGQKNYLGQYELQKWLYRLDSDKNWTDFVKIAMAAKNAGDEEAYEKIRADIIANGPKSEDDFDKKITELEKKAVTDTDEYQTELASLSDSYATMLESNATFQAMDAELQDKARTTMANYAEYQVLGDRIEVDNDQMANLSSIESQGRNPVDWVVFKTQFDTLHSDKDADGKDIPGQKKQDKAIKLIDEIFETDEEKCAAYRSVYDSDANNPWA